MKKIFVVAGLGLVSSVFAAAPDGWQCVDGVYTPIQETVTTYPELDANQKVFVGPGTNVTLSAAAALTNAKQGDRVEFVGSTLTAAEALHVKGNDSYVLFDNATISCDSTLTMNGSQKASGNTEIWLVNGTKAYFKNSLWWASSSNPTSARLVISNATFKADGNRMNIACGAAKTDAGSVCDFAVEVRKGGVVETLGFSTTGNANAYTLKVYDGGMFETTSAFSFSTAAGVNASVIFESGSKVVQTGGSFTANAGAKIQFDLVSPAPEDGSSVFSKLAGDWVKFNDGCLGQISVFKGAKGTYKLMEVMGNPTNAKNGITGFETFMGNVSSTIVGAATLTHWYVKEGSGAQTKYTWYAKVKKQGFAVIIR